MSIAWMKDRVYRTNNQGRVVHQHLAEADRGRRGLAEADRDGLAVGREGWVLRRGRVPLFLDEPEPDPEPDPKHCACGRPLDVVGEHGGGYGAFCG